MTYEYVCEACGHQWEAEQSIKDNPLKECVACHQSKAKRLVSGGTGFLLKGGGWYADLYSSSSASKSADGKTEAPASSGKSDKADKPAEKSGAATESTGSSESKATPAAKNAPAASATPAPSAKAS